MRYPKRWLSCFKAGHRPTAWEFIDEELANKMLARVKRNPDDQEAIETLDYLQKFNSEFHKNVIKKGDPNALHNTDKLRQDCYDRENSRNRDLTSKNAGNMFSIDYLKKQESDNINEKESQTINSNRNLHNHEDVIIELLEQHKKNS